MLTMKCRQVCERGWGGGVNTEQEKMCREKFFVVNLIAFWGSLLRSLCSGRRERGQRRTRGGE